MWIKLTYSTHKQEVFQIIILTVNDKAIIALHDPNFEIKIRPLLVFRHLITMEDEVLILLYLNLKIQVVHGTNNLPYYLLFGEINLKPKLPLVFPESLPYFNLILLIEAN